MMSKGGWYEHKWGGFPALGKLLGRHQVPSRYYWCASASDNIFDRLRRLAEVAVVIKEHRGSIRSVTDPEVQSRLPEDLEYLRDELEVASDFFMQHAKLVRDLWQHAHESQRCRRDAESIGRLIAGMQSTSDD